MFMTQELLEKPKNMITQVDYICQQIEQYAIETGSIEALNIANMVGFIRQAYKQADVKNVRLQLQK